MSYRGGDYFCNEVVNRIGGRWTPSQVLFYLNESLGVISASGSFPWDLVSKIQYNLNTGSNGEKVFNPGDLDIGKKISAFNYPSLTPIVRVSLDDMGAAAAGYVDTGTTEYNAFGPYYTNAGDGQIQFFPSSVSAQVNVYYSQTQPILTTTSSPTLRWSSDLMNSVLLDMTEAACKRVLNFQGWEEREATAKAKLQNVVQMFSVERMNTGTGQELTQAIQEKREIGRV